MEFRNTIGEIMGEVVEPRMMEREDFKVDRITLQSKVAESEHCLSLLEKQCVLFARAGLLFSFFAALKQMWQNYCKKKEGIWGSTRKIRRRRLFKNEAMKWRDCSIGVTSTRRGPRECDVVWITEINADVSVLVPNAECFNLFFCCREMFKRKMKTRYVVTPCWLTCFIRCMCHYNGTLDSTAEVRHGSGEIFNKQNVQASGVRRTGRQGTPNTSVPTQWDWQLCYVIIID